MHVSDDIRLGPVYLPADDFWSSGNPAPMERGVGPLGRVYVWDTVPAANVVNNIALAQTAQSLVLTAGTHTTTRIGSDQKSVGVVLDVPRAVVITATGANTATAIVRGLDQYGQPMTETFAAPATGAVTGKKAFKVILSVTMSAVPGSNIAVGTAGIFGIPFAVRDKGYVIHAAYNAGAVYDLAGLLVADGAAATGTTGDVRGTVALTAPDGVKRLVMVLALSGAQAGPQATRLAAAGVTQFTA